MLHHRLLPSPYTWNNKVTRVERAPKNVATVSRDTANDSGGTAEVVANNR